MSIYTIYRYVYNDETIYIGKTKRNLKLRIYEHSKEDKFLPYIKECQIEYFDAGNRQSMDIYEKYLINEINPILNVADKDGVQFTFSLPYMEWIPYTMYRYDEESPDKKPIRTVGQKIKQKQANIQRSIRASQRRLEEYEKRLEELYSLLHFLAYYSIEDFHSDSSGDVCFEFHEKLPDCIHAIVERQHKWLPVYSKCSGCYRNDDIPCIITYETKMECLKNLFKYGLKFLDIELKNTTRKVIEENMFLRERELEKIKLSSSIVA